MATAAPNRSVPQAWLQPGGLIVAFLGFVVAAFAFTGPRAYDVKFFWVTLGGLALMLGGAFVAGWGRVMAGNRARRGKAAKKAVKAAAETEAPEGKPKRKLNLALPKLREKAASAAPFSGWRKPGDAENAEAAPAEAEAPAEPAAAKAGPFSGWKRPTAATATAPAAEAGAAAEPAREEAPVPPVPEPERTGDLPVTERLTVECPRCHEKFTVEGVRPIRIQCQGCKLTGTVQ